MADKKLLTKDLIEAEIAKCHQSTRLIFASNPKAPTGFGVRITQARASGEPGSASFFLNFYVQGVEYRTTIGRFGDAPRLSVTAAILEANRLRTLVNAGRNPLEEKRQAKAAAKAAAETAKARAEHTLAALMAAYIGELRAQGKSAAREAENLFNRAVAVPYPKIARKSVDEIDVEAVMPAMHRLTKANHYRDAEKLATYLKRAFNAAREARTDARGHAYTEFKITSNPLADLRVSRPDMTEHEAARVEDEKLWTLSQPQLATYWKRIASTDDAYGAMMRLHLLTGGQRREQLARARRSDLTVKTQVLRLWDRKGRRKKPREHLLPLLPEAQAAIESMAGNDGTYLFSTTNGATPATPAILDHAIARVSAQMVEAKELPEGRTITPGVIRRTVETLLGESGVSLEIRAQLQSHGLGTVQHRHYDRGDYLRHKREALETWRALCEPMPNNVTAMSRRRKTKAA